MNTNQMALLVLCKTIVRDRRAGPLAIDMMSDIIEKCSRDLAEDRAMQSRIAAAMKETMS